VDNDGSTFNPAPGWPAPPLGWRPPPGWAPDPSWAVPPPGWEFWTPRIKSAPREAAPEAAARPFLLWGTRGSWCNQEVAGTQYRQDAVTGLFPRDVDLDDGAERNSTAALVPEPQNPKDPHAVAVRVDGVHVGYLPAEVAPDYAPVLQTLCSAGLAPTVPVHVWARAYTDYDEQVDGSHLPVRRHYTRVSVALAEPEMLRPLNLAPPRPRAELPVGSSVKVVNTQANFEHLNSVLNGRPAGWVYATLHRGEPATPRSKTPTVEVRVSGLRAGGLTVQMSATYLPVIDHLDRAGTMTVCRVLLEGSPVSVVAAIHALRPHELTPDWFTAVGSPST